MKIASVEIFHIDLRDRPPRHQLVVLRLRTDEGVCGLGEIAMAYGDGAESCVAMAAALAKKYVLGADAGRPEALWQRIFRDSYWGAGRSLALYGALSAFDIACWDIKARAAGLPVHALLGGKVREDVELYANHWYRDAYTPEEFAERARSVLANGFRGLKFDPLRANASHCEIPSAWLSREIERLALDRVAAVREAVGPDTRLCIDLHGSSAGPEALRLVRALEPFRPYFVEEATDTLAVAPWQNIRAQTRLPLAGGERLYTRQDFIPFFEARVFDFIQPDLCLAGGFTEMRKIAAMADAYHVAVQPHNCAGPICSAATLQLVATLPNFVLQEWFPYWEDNRGQIVTAPLEGTERDGRISIPDGPGLGLELDEKFMRPWLAHSIRVP